MYRMLQRLIFVFVLDGGPSAGLIAAIITVIILIIAAALVVTLWRKLKHKGKDKKCHYIYIS